VPESDHLGGDTTTLPPRIADALRLLSGGHGSFVLIEGGERATRADYIGAIEERARAEGSETVTLRAHPSDREIPYGALHPLLADWYRPKESDQPDVRATSSKPSLPLALLIASIRAEKEEAGRKRTRLLPSAPAGRALSPAEMRAELLDLVEGRILKSAAVITLMDAEYLDSASREWMAFLAPRLQELSILIAISLPEDEHLHPGWQKALANSPVVLHHLPSRDPSQGKGDRIAQRIRKLDERALSALSLVVVAGQDARRDLLQEVSGTAALELSRALAPVVQAGLVDVEGDNYVILEPDLSPNLGGSIPDATVRALHQAVACAILKREPHPRGGLLFRVAAHWAEAREVGLGVPALMAAGEEAERWGSLELAETWLRQAARLSQIDPTLEGRKLEEQIYARLAGVLRRNTNHAGSSRAYRRALAINKQRGAKGYQWVDYVSGISETELSMGEDPRETIQSALQQVRGHNSDKEAVLLRTLSNYFMDRGQAEESQTTAERACSLADQGHDAGLKVRVHVSAANSYIFSSREPYRAYEHLLKVQELRPALEGTVDEVLGIDGDVLLMLMESVLGNFEEAVRHGERALGEARRYGNATTLLTILGNLGEVCVYAKDLSRAREVAQEMRRLCDRLSVMETDADRLQLHLLDGIIAAGEDRFTEARRCMEFLIRAAEKSKNRLYEAQALTHLASLAAREGNREEAHKYVRQLVREGLKRVLMMDYRLILAEVEQFLSTEEEKR